MRLQVPGPAVRFRLEGQCSQEIAEEKRARSQPFKKSGATWACL